MVSSQFVPSNVLISISGFSFVPPSVKSTQYSVIPIPSGFDLGLYHGKMPFTSNDGQKVVEVRVVRNVYHDHH